MKESSPAECKSLLTEGEHKYLDVRTPEEFQAGHVEGATNVPVMLKKDGNMTPNEEFLPKVQGAFPDKVLLLMLRAHAKTRFRK